MKETKRKTTKKVKSKVEAAPIIGILTLANKKNDFLGNKQNFIDIITNGQQYNQNVYVVTTADLRINQQQIYGYYYDATFNKWRRKKIPLPKVLYNRISYRKYEALPKTKRLILRCLKNQNIHLFNPFFFNKWSLFQWLKKSNTTKNYIPITQRLKGWKEMNTLIKQFDTLYIKPIKGKAGSGIMRVRKMTGVEELGELPYELKIQRKKSIGTYQFNTIQSLHKTIKKNTGHGKYIIQQGIQLAKNYENPFDLRVLIQKNGSGLWNITGIGARVAGANSITTHVPRGGKIDEPNILLTSYFGKEKADQLIEDVRNVTIKICHQIEKASAYPLGEMSMDLGIDEKGKIWFFEANSRPMKFDEPHIRNQSLTNIIKYSQFLMNTQKRTYKIKRREKN
ncbi:YheC/YheD family protein [Chengkuizengella sediminis]|uniref:YheC/YheD family endospore coat-associated protein n=1 Tax=Chengkuizengella sediminis TaxID=1885917 RepID=UPI0013898446|nr:YheC/YheD family protein [Chengkuizengella sediminis]NDI36299.1 YheC/YheD family protein [Chengkuizengella sediminis]